MAWTKEKEQWLRNEVERLYKDRTPPKRLDEMLVGYRVNRAEIRTLAERQFGEMPPETDRQWLESFLKFYQGLVRKYKDKIVAPPGE